VNSRESRQKRFKSLARQKLARESFVLVPCVHCAPHRLLSVAHFIPRIV
jgi:hypothetical protein